MKQIAAISENKIDDLPQRWRLAREEIAIAYFAWRPRPKKTIKAVNRGNYIMLATNRKLRQDVAVRPDMAIADGRLLQLSFLKEALDMMRPAWRQETLVINIDNIAGRLALSSLLSETDNISVIGQYAPQVSASLFAKYGIITQPSHTGFRLHQLALPTSIETEQGLVSIDVAEALLALGTGYYPIIHPVYLRKLRAAAMSSGFYPSAPAQVRVFSADSSAR